MEWDDKVKDVWASTETKPAAGPRVPDGKNRAKIVDAGYDPTMRAVKWSLEFVDAGGKRLTKTNFLYDKAGTPQFQWTKQDLDTLGSPCAELDQLEEALAATIGTMAQVTLVTPAGTKFTNIYFNHRIDGADAIEADVPSDW